MPYEFQGYATESAGLKCGDYSLAGHEQSVAVERKSKEDAWGCVGGGRERFVRCLQRLASVESPAIIIEANLDDFVVPPPYTRLSSAQGVVAFLSWSQEFRIPVFFCPGRGYGERVTVQWLTAYWRHYSRRTSDG